ncbi:MAG: hypothetical protein Kow0013_20490 [Pararhodobacter sp.]
MPPVTLTDLSAAARVLLAVPESRREAALAALLARAALADRTRRETGRLHPVYGNGTLMAAALAHPRADPASPGDSDYLACLAAVIDAILARRGASKA